ncbi:MAG: chemotaxis protein CheC [Geobacteraceae bacterium]|nr:chemotaxis protein CheC [Geobacteraceae bacterium]
MLHLSDAGQDALQELFNIGMGHAAASLERMLGTEICLSVPFLTLLSAPRAATRIETPDHAEVSTVRQAFSGPFSGTALLIFPETNCVELIRTLVDDAVPLETLGELEQDSLLEIGNIVLNACLGSFANLMQKEIDFELPTFLRGSCRNLLASNNTSAVDEPLIFLEVNFNSREGTAASNSIKGFVVLLLDARGSADLQQELQHLLGGQV